MKCISTKTLFLSPISATVQIHFQVQMSNQSSRKWYKTTSCKF